MKRWLYALIPLFALGLLIAWRYRANKAQADELNHQREARKTSAPVVSVVPARMRDIVHTFETVGSAESPFNVKIAAKVTGRIDFLELREGAPVTSGQVVARIDPSQVEAQMRQ